MISGLKKARSELIRVVSLGLEDCQPDVNGVRFPARRTQSEISFPEETYLDKDLSREDFWSRFRVEKLVAELERKQIDVIWEFGGGDGRVSIPLVSNGFGVISVEPLYSGCVKVAKHGIPIFCGTIQDLRLPKGILPAIGFFDVLEHIKNEAEFLNEVHRCLDTNGRIFLTVPAHQWLFSNHDLALGHFRRYSKAALEERLLSAGFKVEKIGFLFSVLVLPAFFLRRIPFVFGKKREVKQVLDCAETVLRLPKILNEMLLALSRIESKLRIPVGLSLFAVAKKS